MEMDRPQDDSSLDQATARRLSRLRTLPVDTSSLEKSLRKAIPELTAARPLRTGVAGRLRPLRALAASLLVVGAVVAAILIATSGNEVMASPTQMARLHDELVSGKEHVHQVDSIDAANRFITAQWSQGAAPTVPDLPTEHVMACCMKSVQNKRVACVLLKGHAGEALTLSVANSADMKLPRGAMTMQHNGVTYHVQSSDSVNMVMTEQNGRWVCLMGRTPTERLIELAAELKF